MKLSQAKVKILIRALQNERDRLISMHSDPFEVTQFLREVQHEADKVQNEKYIAIQEVKSKSEGSNIHPLSGEIVDV